MQRKAGRGPSGQTSRLKPVSVDPLEEYGLPSKGDKRLLSPKIQEAYYSRIADRYLAFCTEAGDRDALQKQFLALTLTERPQGREPPATSAAPAKTATPSGKSTELAHILDALRRLREGIVASKRKDDFACQVYLFNIRLGILAASYETYHAALLYLLHSIHPTHGLTSVELQEIVGYLVLDTACRRGDLAEAYALRNRHHLRDPKVDAVLRALATDNWVLWRQVKLSVDGHKTKIMEFGERQLKAHTLKAFGRAYLSVSQEFLETSTLSKWPELQAGYGVGWELDDGKVIIRKVQAKK
ncbi:hypothetical protein GQ53DRAFT_665742 [Thozetella sp. PMI_491]|nr:hypothetical protein GQ53DRAFT_665742 [Thozetella sp. PMI_491]